jgi:SulP family sulfate permease
MVGVFVLVEMLLFQNLLGLIPQAVFAGVLFKVGYDVFDWRPLRLYVKELATYRSRLLVNFCDRHDEEPIFVSNREMLMILGTAGVTIVFDLNLAVGGFTLLFYLHNKLLCRGNPIRDLMPATETEALTGED